MGPNQAASDSAVRGLTRFLASNYEVNDTAVTLHTAEAKGCETQVVVEKALAKAVVTKTGSAGQFSFPDLKNIDVTHWSLFCPQLLGKIQHRYIL